MRIAGLAVAALVAALAAGCGERAEPTGPSVDLYPVTIGTAGRKPLVAQERARRIAALTPGAVRTLAALGAAERVVGAPSGVRARFTPRAASVVDPGGHVLVDELRRARPDLVVASPLFSPDELEGVGAATGAAVYVAPESSLRDLERAITDLGLLVGEPLAARRVVARIEAARKRVAERVADEPVVSVFLDTGFFTTVSDRSLVGDLIRRSRGRNVAGPTPESGPFDLGLLARRNPRVYLATSDSDTTLRSLRKNRRTRKLAAVRAGRFRVIPAELLQPGPRIGEGLTAIARALHPDAFR